MTDPDSHPYTDKQIEEIIDSLTNEIASLKFHLTKKHDRISSLDALLNTLMEGHNAEVRAYKQFFHLPSEGGRNLTRRRRRRDITRTRLLGN